MSNLCERLARAGKFSSADAGYAPAVQSPARSGSLAFALALRPLARGLLARGLLALGLLALGLLATPGCGAGSSPRADTARADAPAQVQATAQPWVAPDPDRALGARASFGELVRAARGRIRSGAATAGGPCLLRALGGGYAFDAELMPALDGLPDAPVELDSQLAAAAGATAVLSAFGVVGPADAALVATGFTAISPERLRDPFALLVLTDEGVHLRLGPAAAAQPSAPQPAADALHALATARTPPSVCYVTAEADAPVAGLAALLAGLPAGCAAALALVLPAGTRLPAPSTPAGASAASCPEGLPEPPADAAEGSLQVADLRAALAPLAERAQRCLDRALSADANGVRITLALRIDERGALERACVIDAAPGREALSACIVDATHGIAFAAPSPPGFVDVQLPLSLTPTPWSTQRAFCAQ